MPIEIRELVIKATLSDEAENSPAGEQSSGNNPAVSDALVNACVEKVMEIIKQKTER